MCTCCNATYYSETKRNLFVRASEHLGITPFIMASKKGVKKPPKIKESGFIVASLSYSDFTQLLFWFKHYTVMFGFAL